MIIQLISLILITIFGLVNISFNLAPLFIILSLFLLGIVEFLANIHLIMLLILLSSLFLMILLYLYEILEFYTNFRVENRLKGIVEYTKTKYVKVLEIFIDDLHSQANVEKKWLKFYVINDDKIKIYSFGNLKIGIIVLSTGMLDKLIELIKTDREKAMRGFEFIIGHELSHIKNEHFISADFFTSNVKLGSQIRIIYTIIFKIIGLIFRVIPFFGKFIAMMLDYINSLLAKFLSISSKPLDFIYKIIRSSLFQLQELKADKESVLIFGPTIISSFFEFFPKYSNSFSTHLIKNETRFKKVKDLTLSKEKFSFTEDNKETLLTCYISLILIIACLLTLLIILISNLQFELFYNLIKMELNTLNTSADLHYKKLIEYLKPIKELFF